MVLGLRVGAGASADAYNAAFQLPDLLNHFLAGGALSIAFVPLWTSTRARDGRRRGATGCSARCSARSRSPSRSLADARLRGLRRRAGRAPVPALHARAAGAHRAAHAHRAARRRSSSSCGGVVAGRADGAAGASVTQAARAARLQPRASSLGGLLLGGTGSASRASPGARSSAPWWARSATAARRARARAARALRVAPRDPDFIGYARGRGAARAGRHAAHGRRVVRPLVRRARRRGHDRRARLRAPADAAAGRGGRPGDRDRRAADALAALSRRGASRARPARDRARCRPASASASPRRRRDLGGVASRPCG